MVNKTILFVDDETFILHALQRIFRRDGYNLILVDTPEKALEVLEKESVDLVISDLKMTQMNGYELLNIIKGKYPQIIRVILSGCFQEREVLQAILDGTAKMYLSKPWENEVLLQTVKNIFSLQETLNNKNLLIQISQLDLLPTLPALYKQLCQMIEEDVSIAKITQAIETDPAVAANVLRMANTAFGGIHTASLKQAVTYLGLSVTKEVVLASSIFEHAKTNFLLELFWKHANLTNQLLRLMWERFLNQSLREEYSTVGLLHNIGQVVLMKQNKDCYATLFLEATQKRQPIDALERDAFGISHQELSGYLLNWWNLPLSTAESALYCQSPLAEEILNKEMVCTLHLASNYSWEFLNRKELSHVEPGVLAILGIREKDCKEMQKELQLS